MFMNSCRVFQEQENTAVKRRKFKLSAEVHIPITTGVLRSFLS
jgi:hypothetical protein